ncbi:MAG: MBL fold metallo-hydrolase, partial [Oscillospiraceae bacterium]|nr:MBL fold metallo-hydrolase [Oscillospiraceae bacterium]
MKITRLIMGMFQANTYIVSKGDTAVVIDPAGSADAIAEEITRGGKKLAAILLTHGHFDHTSACAKLRELTGAKIHIHEGDKELLADKKKSFASIMAEEFCPCSADVLIQDGQELVFGELCLKVKHTPGHSPG